MGSKRVLDLFWRHRRSYVSPIDFARIRSWIRWMGLLFAIFVLYTWMDSFFSPSSLTLDQILVILPRCFGAQEDQIASHMVHQL